MATIHKLKKDGTVAVPAPVLKHLGWKPGAPLFIRIVDNSLVLEHAPHPLPPRTLNAVKRLRGSLKHLAWGSAHRELRTRWGAWRDRLSA
jgi:bifunctional DNA-binding transcriptional regulator/antitoxin component of YhaV-PrlF toxin-antitoxin module